MDAKSSRSLRYLGCLWMIHPLMSIPIRWGGRIEVNEWFPSPYYKAIVRSQISISLLTFCRSVSVKGAGLKLLPK